MTTDPRNTQPAEEPATAAPAGIPSQDPRLKAQEPLTPLERVYDLGSLDNKRVKTKRYDSDISREKFAQIEPLLRSVRRRTKPTTIDMYKVFCAVLYVLRTGCQWRLLSSEWPKWQTVYSYFAKWNKPDEHGISVLERALKKSGWRSPTETGAQRVQRVLDHRRAEREEHGHGSAQGR